MPTSTQTQTGFSVGKWELYYLRGRYKSHRNKVAAAKPAIDSKPPAPRPHVHYKRKKGLDEKQRQTYIMIENLRILNKTSEIMSGSDYNYYHRPLPLPLDVVAEDDVQPQPAANKKRVKPAPQVTHGKHHGLKSVPGPRTGHSHGHRSAGNFHEEQLHQRQSQPITLIMKKNTHVMLRWFLRRFGEYVPWWAELTY